MLIYVSIAAALTMGILFIQIAWANRFVDLYRHPQLLPDDSELPHVGVIMSLRGADPFLAESLRGLVTLDYPSHEIRIIVDSHIDPALEIVERVLSEHNATHAVVELLELRQETSSLKNSALIQGINGCSDRCEAYAWLDSDTVPYPGWLKHLVSPLRHDSVGAACGIRWYSPPTQTIANYVRHIWNAAAVLQMVAFGIGWGGAFAIRRSVYEKANLAEKWSRALVEDTLASNEVLADGKRVEFVAAATMPNPESATFRWSVRFVTRQLQGLRYYHGSWRTVLWFGLFSGFVVTTDLVLTVIAALRSDYLSAGIGAAAIVVMGTVCGWLMNRSERMLINYLQDRSVGTTSSFPKLILAAPIAQLVHLIALIRTYAFNDVTWRGIHYRIRSGMDVTRTNYSPYEAETTDSVRVPSHSL